MLYQPSNLGNSRSQKSQYCSEKLLRLKKFYRTIEIGLRCCIFRKALKVNFLALCIGVKDKHRCGLRASQQHIPEEKKDTISCLGNEDITEIRFEQQFSYAY